MSERIATQKRRCLDTVIEIAKGNVVRDFLESLKDLPRPAVGFAVKADLKMCTNGRGIGVFSAEFLPAGTRVDVDREEITFTREQAIEFLEAVPNDNERRWWLEHIYCLDGLMKIDMAELDISMVNHSNDPNVVTRENGLDYTTRDVNIGEELTEDYKTYDKVSYYEELCQKYGVIHYCSEWT
ncbi:uncharacterized protein LOC114530332 [Dendronephthya gigantea]|uniref:uncharacterized protein LOC114530332 n=1 Tax=Dendronephthya gigantea TaxID=151771 RepID=UPI00106B2280|nr:uncharacterized protein LOC114530332 [Dendronephthya gigantea]